jgi:hypothetical protein
MPIPNLFDIKSYGAIGDGTMNDTEAIVKAIAAIPITGGRLFFPSGTYLIERTLTIQTRLSIPEYVHLVFDEGARLEPSGIAVFIQGAVTCHPSQHIFSGTGFNEPITKSSEDHPDVTVSGSAFGNYKFVVQIESGGELGTATFKYAVDGGGDNSFSPPRPTADNVLLPQVGLTLHFQPGNYPAGAQYFWTSLAPITLAPKAFEQISARNFGAVPDYNPKTKTGTPNLKFFQTALGALASIPEGTGNRSAKLLIDGHYYLEDTLILAQTVVLEGTGINYSAFHPTRSKPGGMLVFPGNKTGIRIQATINNLRQSGERTILRNLAVYCHQDRGEEVFPNNDARPPRGYIGHGIHASSFCTIQNVIVQNFAEHGIWITDSGAGTHIINTSSHENGGHGFYFYGIDANVSLIEMCDAKLNWGYGFRDEGGIGNTYVACYGQGNLGESNNPGEPVKSGEPNGYSIDRYNHDFYAARNGGNSSLFLGCYSEDSIDHIYAPACVIGGALAQSTFTLDSNVFALNGGTAAIGSLVAEYKNDLNSPHIEIGGPPISAGGLEPIPHALSLITRKAGLPPDFLWLVYLAIGRRREVHNWWEFRSNDVYHPLMRFPTSQSNARHTAPWMTNGLFIGRDDLPNTNNPIHMTAAPLTTVSSPPTTQGDGGSSPQTYERGDIIWNNEPVPGGAIGQVCIESGTQSELIRGETRGWIMQGSYELIVNTASHLSVGQYITIPGIGSTDLNSRRPDTRKILAIKGLKMQVTLDTNADKTVAEVPIYFGKTFTSLQSTQGAIRRGSTELVVESIAGLTVGEYIAISGLSGLRQIKDIKDQTVILDLPATIDAQKAEVISGMAFGITLGSIDQGSKHLLVNAPTDVAVGQPLVITGVAGIKTIVDVEHLKLTLDTPTNTAVNNVQVAFGCTVGTMTENTTEMLVNSTARLYVDQAIVIAGIALPRTITNIEGLKVTFTPAIAEHERFSNTPIALSKMVGFIRQNTTELLLRGHQTPAVGQYIRIAGIAPIQKIIQVRTLALTDKNEKQFQVTLHKPVEVSVNDADVLMDVAFGMTLGSIQSGSTELIVNASAGLEIGQALEIAGVSGIMKILDIQPFEVMIDQPAVQTVSNALLSFSPATFSTFGRIDSSTIDEIDSPSKAYGENKVLNLSDRYVTVTAPGKTMTLPATPLDGQTHAIKSQPGITADVDTADRRAIDGQLTIPLAGGESATFRYSAAIGEWERRC